MYQPTTRSKIAGDASLADKDPLDTKLGHKDGHREKYLNQSHAQNCRRRLTRRHIPELYYTSGTSTGWLSDWLTLANQRRKTQCGCRGLGSVMCNYCQSRTEDVVA